jgi:hypothetical protein
MTTLLPWAPAHCPAPPAPSPPVVPRLLLNDTQRIEAALPARLMWRMTANMAANPDPTTDKDFLNRVAAAFAIHRDDAFSGLDGARQEKMKARLKRVSDLVLDPFIGRSLPTSLHATKVLIQDLLESGVWTYPDGGAFEVAYGALAEVIWSDERNVESLTATERSATKNARKMRERLKAAGYYLRPYHDDFLKIGVCA